MIKTMTNTLQHATGILALLVLLMPVTVPAVDYEYDSLDRLTSVLFEDGQRMNYRFDPAGNIVMVWTGLASAIDDGRPDLQDLRFLLVGKPSPNPFNARVTIALEIRARQNVKVNIFDLRGRLIRRLIDEVVNPGTARIFWDGRDDRGAAVASGPYFGQVHTEYKTECIKMMLVK